MSNKKQYTIDITEAKAVKLFDEKYGRDLASRFLKLQEEFREFQEALEEFLNNPTPENLAHLKDEKSDLHAVDTHISNMLGLCSEQMLDMAIDKVKGREEDPNYKRYPKLVKNVCPDCNTRTLIMFTADLDMCTNCKKQFDGK